MSSFSKSSINNNDSNTPATILLLAAGALMGASMTLLTTWMLTSRCTINHDETRRDLDVLEEYSNSQNNKSIQNGTIRSPPSSSSTNSNISKQCILPTALRQEQLSRHTLYFGARGMERLRQARICVVGVGGVGSHAVHMLARSGVGCIRFVDFDQVSLSSLNRHACATLQDVGTSKVDCLTRYCSQLCPDSSHLDLQPYCEMYTEQSGARLLDPYFRPRHDEDSGIEIRREQAPRQWDLVIDAIDDVPTKACLIADCLQRGIRVLSCMGAGGKCDFTRLHVSDLRGAVKDPLATKLRQALKKKMLQRGSETAAKSGSSDNHQLENSSIKKKRKNSTKADDDADDSSFYLDDMGRLAVVYSSEKPVCKLADFTPQQKQDGVHQYGAVDGMRIRILPVLGTMPAIMGQGLAAVALTELAATVSKDKNFEGSKRPEDLPPPRMQPVTVERVSRNVRNRLLQRFTTREDQYGTRIMQEHSEKANTSATRDLASGGTWFKIVDKDDSSTETIWIGPPQIDFDDVEYLMDVWRNRCAVTGARLGTVLELTRWDVSKPSTCDNVILVASYILEKFQANSSKGTNNTEWIEPRIRFSIQERLASCRISDSEA